MNEKQKEMCKRKYIEMSDLSRYALDSKIPTSKFPRQVTASDGCHYRNIIRDR